MNRTRRLIVFDLDDTLYLERDYAQSGFRAVGRWLEDSIGPNPFADLAWGQFCMGRRNDIFDAVLEEMDIRANGALIRQLVSVYRHHHPDIHLAPDAARLLGAHPPEGTRYALITDGFLAAQTRKLRALGLSQMGLWPLICTDIWGRGYWKPHARAFECVQAMHGLPSHAITYVADNATKDFIAPRRLGWNTVELLRPERVRANEYIPSGEGADRSVVSLDALEERHFHSLG